MVASTATANGAAGAASGAAAAAEPQRPEPAAELGSKAALEAELVAAVLHLLVLTGQASGAAGLASSQQVLGLQALVQQAQQEVLLQQAGGGGGCDGGEDGLAAAAAAPAAVMYDLSLVSAGLASAAACCIDLLGKQVN